MATLRDGAYSWSSSRDAEGHREYKLTHLVNLDPGEGPMAVYDCPGLPAVGSFWQMDNDTDPDATCLPTATITSHGTKAGHPVQYVLIEQTFSTKPPDASKSRCSDTPVGDPLLEPMKVSGSYTRFQEEATEDRFGKSILTSSHEIIRGPHVEFDHNRGTVKVEQNVPVLGIEVFQPMIDTLNDRPLWGLPARCIKLSSPSWERKFYGHCNVYYTRTFTFEVNVVLVAGQITSGWDRLLLDEGSKVLNGHFDPSTGAWVIDPVGGQTADARNPEHFIKAKDRQGNDCTVVLNGAGLPASMTVVGTPVTVVDVTVLTDNSNPVIANQPTTGLPARLVLELVDDDNSITQGFIRITGTDSDDAVIQEDWDLSDSGTVKWATQQTYKTVTQVHVGSGVAGLPALVGAGAADTIKITTDSSKTDVGKILVEKYTESNFLLLGIPLVL